MKYITRQEELVLLVIYRLGETSYLMNIQEKLIEVTKKDWSLSSVYMPLNKLARQGYLKTHTGLPSAKRGGRAIKYYQLTKKALDALNEIRSINSVLWEDITELKLES